MKSSLKAKLIQHLAAKKGNAGFTLIELLVVIIIIGILSAIALPSFLNQANKARQSEAKTYVGSVNRAQQAAYLENGQFAVGDDVINSEANKDAIEELGIGIPLSTENYAYLIQGDEQGGVTAGAQQILVNDAGVAEDAPESALKAYIGGVAIATVVETGEATTVAVLCSAEKSRKALAAADGKAEVIYAQLIAENPDNDAACGANYEPI